MPKSMYRPADMLLWRGRVDDPADNSTFRWHQVVQLLDLAEPNHLLGEGGPAKFCLLGFASDEGVTRNLGRPGAAEGPVAIRRALSSLPWQGLETARLYDAGDVVCTAGELETAQNLLAAKVEQVCRLGAFPIILGGGHEVAFGCYHGLYRAWKEKVDAGERFGIINFDAHFDIRPLSPKPSSGTMFGQIAAARVADDEPFDYLCLGIQKAANTPALFTAAEELGVHYLFAEQLEPQQLDTARQQIEKFTAACDALYLTLCADVIAAAYAPGVSAPQPFGLHPDTVRRLLMELVASGKVVGFDIAEVAPALDRDNMTAALAAQLIFYLLDGLLQCLSKNGGRNDKNY